MTISTHPVRGYLLGQRPGERHTQAYPDDRRPRYQGSETYRRIRKLWIINDLGKMKYVHEGFRNPTLGKLRQELYTKHKFFDGSASVFGAAGDDKFLGFFNSFIVILQCF